MYRVCIAAILIAAGAWGQALQKITINYPTRSGASWPLYIAKEGGYYQKNGLDVTLVFGVHPAGIAMLTSGEAKMANYSLEQSMQAASKDGSFVFVGSTGNRGFFSLMGRKDLTNIREVKGKRIAVSQIGDAPYNYTIALLGKYGIGARDVEWIPVGTDVSGRAAALQGGRADATLLTAPNYFRLEEAGFKNLANMSEHEDIFASTTLLMTKAAVAANPKLPEQFIKAEAEAIQRFYEDKAFAIKAYAAFDKQPEPDVSRIYDQYVKSSAFEKIPYVLAGAIKSVIDQQADPRIAADLKAFDFHKVVDNGYIDRLVKEGYFQKLFGAGIKTEEARKSKLAFR